MRKLLWITGCAISFVAGAAIALAYVTISGSRVSRDWLDLSKPKEGKGILYSTEAIFKADISLPDIKQFGGKAKFLESATSPGSYGLGYVANVSVPPLDLKKVPKKYLIDKPVEIDGVKTTELGIKQVHYDVVFDFTQQDRDGFTLLELSSEPHSIEFGKNNEFQSVVKTNVPREVAARVTHVVIQLSVQKCITCQGE